MKGRISFRNRWVFCLALIGEAIIFLLGFTGAVATADRIIDRAFFGAIAALGMWAIACAGIFPRIRVIQDFLVVDNGLVQHLIPWSEIKRIDVNDGLVVVLKGQPEDIGVFGFSGSLIASITGYRKANRVADKIRSYLKENGKFRGDKQVVHKVKLRIPTLVSWWLFFLILAPFFRA
jgi:hypothetical protein